MALMTNPKVALVIVVYGNLDENGRPDDQTMRKIEKARSVAHGFANAGCPYHYVLADNRKIGQARVCDVMSHELRRTDQGSRSIHVPPSGQVLDTVDLRQAFANEAIKTAGTRLFQYI